MIILNDGKIKAWVNGLEIEDTAKKQLDNLAKMTFIHSHIAVMPDVHAGCGSTVGSVIPSYNAIIPAAVGVDIGCGMMAVKTSLLASDLPDNLFLLRSMIESAVPHGRTDNGRENDRGAWGEVPNYVAESWSLIIKTLDSIVDKHQKLTRAYKRSIYQLGTLGTGNHFIEICLDENQSVWVMLHSGSRGIGNAIGSYFIEKAKADMTRWFINLPDKDLAYIPEGSALFNDYLSAIRWAQEYAGLNRQLMMKATLDTLSQFLEREFEDNLEAINCHHNYVRKEKHFGKYVYLTRKGAVRIQPDIMGIIPGSMGAKSFIVRGKEGEALAQAYNSCSHGAGRSMSRTQAKKIFTLNDHIQATNGVECRKDEEVLDETPGAYKDIDKVMAAQLDHVEIVHTLKQILCVKG